MESCPSQGNSHKMKCKPSDPEFDCPVGWGYRIHQLLLCMRWIWNIKSGWFFSLHCPVKVGFWNTDVLNLWSAQVINTSRKEDLLSCPFSIVNCINGWIISAWTSSWQYLNFNFNHPYNVKKGIICCLQYQTKAISSDDVYQEEKDRFRDNAIETIQLPKEHNISSKKSRLQDRGQNPKTYHILSTLCERLGWKNQKNM